jgi:hypothetical protein
VRKRQEAGRMQSNMLAESLGLYGKKRTELQDNSSVPTGSLIEQTGDKTLRMGGKLWLTRM